MKVKEHRDSQKHAREGIADSRNVCQVIADSVEMSVWVNDAAVTLIRNNCWLKENGWMQMSNLIQLYLYSIYLCSKSEENSHYF